MKNTAIIYRITGVEYPPDPVVIASGDKREMAENAADLLADGFNWSLTAEGSTFWSDVCKRLRQIADNGVLK